MCCFGNASPGKSCFVVDLVCFILLCLRVAVFLNAMKRDRNLPPFVRENSGSMQFVETKERNSRLQRELKVYSLHFRLEDLRNWKNRLNEELIRYLVVFQHVLHGNYLDPMAKKSSDSWKTSPVSKVEVVYVRASLAQNCKKQILQCNDQVNELQLRLSLKPVKALSQMTTTWG